MKLKINNAFSGLILITLFAVLVSCEKEPAVPTASFSYTADGRVVTFNNTSTDATTFAWDFGDGTTSTEKSPVHTYELYGTYTVKMSATGEGGTANSLPDNIVLAKSSAVKIGDGFGEWANIPEVTGFEKFGSISKVKVDYDALNLYFYVEGAGGSGGPGVNGGLNGFFDIYLNSDNKAETGYTSGWYPNGFGADFLVEGDLAIMKDAELFKHKSTALPTEFLFDKVGLIGGNIIKSSGMTAVGSGKAIEFSISRSALTNLASKITYAIVDVDGNYYFPDNTKSRSYSETWATVGSFPKDNTAEGKMIELDLTK